MHFYQELGARLSASDCCYMVVFQYGSIVLFNISENMVDAYLKIVERHASGLLSETKKDGEILSFVLNLLQFFSFINLSCAYGIEFVTPKKWS